MRYILLLTTLLAFQSTADINVATTLEQAAAGNAAAQFKVGKKYSEFANLGYGVTDNKKALVYAVVILVATVILWEYVALPVFVDG